MSKLPIFNLKYEKENGEILDFDGSFLFHTNTIGQLKHIAMDRNSSTYIFNDIFSIEQRKKNINTYNDILMGKGTFINFYDNLENFLPKIENNFQEYKNKLSELSSLDRRIEYLNFDIENVKKGSLHVFDSSGDSDSMYFHDSFPDSFYSEGYISFDSLKEHADFLNKSKNIPLNGNLDLPFVYGSEKINFTVNAKSIIEDWNDFKENLVDDNVVTKTNLENWLGDWWENELSEWPEDSLNSIVNLEEFDNFMIDFFMDRSASSDMEVDIEKIENFIENWMAKQNLHCFMVNFNLIISFAQKKKEELIEEIEDNKERIAELKMEKMTEEWIEELNSSFSFK